MLWLFKALCYEILPLRFTWWMKTLLKACKACTIKHSCEIWLYDGRDFKIQCSFLKKATTHTKITSSWSIKSAWPVLWLIHVCVLHCRRLCRLKMPAMLQITLTQGIEVCFMHIIWPDCWCTKTRAPHDHFRRIMMYKQSPTLQKTWSIATFVHTIDNMWGQIWKCVKVHWHENV